ncbi:MAG: amidohydrolase family protein [Planctomycetes bacterium]|nr:amidohydrolase family protein [Planctomycetota bacterium]
MAEGSLRVRLLCCAPDHWLAPAEIAWDANGRIVGLRRARRGTRIRDLAVLPGLVNGHAHLQLGPLAAAPRTFLPWVRAVLAARVGETPRSFRARAAAAVTELQADGTTAVGEIDGTGLSGPVLARRGLAGRCYQELFGFHLDERAANALVRARHAVRSGALARGLSPHAPHTTSPALLRAAARASRFLSIHCAETAEEQQFLHTGRGPFADLLSELGRLPAGFRPPRCGAVTLLARLGVLRPTTQLIHAQHLERGDSATIRDSGAALVVCPGTIAWFRRPLPPVPSWLRQGIPVGLGTDSVASNERLSMRAELSAAAAAWPELPPAMVFAMATTHAARGLGVAAGRLRHGGRADCFAVGAGTDSPAQVLAAVVHGHAATVATWTAGRRTTALPR